ncbi:MAG: inositol monophosphatase [Candidatus Nanohaloarchaea archaeon]
MNFDDSPYSKELEAARDAARKAGKIIDRYRRGKIEVDGRKASYNDIVTEADLEVQEKIVEVIRDRFPGDAIKAEEQQLSEDHSDRVWVIDPIDGTMNFFHGLDYFCTSIGLKIGKSGVLGVVHSPVTGLDETFIGLEDHGAFRLSDIDAEEGERLSVSTGAMKGELYTTYVRDGEPDKREVQLETISRFSGREMVHRASGAAALDICRIAGGDMSLLSDFLGEWDYAAGRTILEEAGGEIDVLGTATDQDMVVASSGEFHDEAVEIVEDTLERF